MKVIKKSRLTNGQIHNLNDPAKIMNEVNILKALKHVIILNIIIIKCFKLFDEHLYIYKYIYIW